MIELQDIVQLAGTVLSLVGFGSLIGLLINLGKSVKIIKDGQSQNWAMGLNLLLLVVMYLGGFLGFDMAFFDGIAGQIASVGVAVLELISMIAGSKAYHSAVRSVPVIGRSFSDAR